jgi:hypothetical protein
MKQKTLRVSGEARPFMDGRSHLSTLSSENATKALAYILKCEQGGGFDNFTPDSQLDGYRRYFEAP